MYRLYTRPYACGTRMNETSWMVHTVRHLSLSGITELAPWNKTTPSRATC